MSDTRPIGNLGTYVARTWTTGESLTRTKLQSQFDQVASLLQQIIAAGTDIQNHRSKTGHSPTENNIAGQIVHDPDDDKWYGDPDGSGADDDLATRLKAYAVAFATAGAGTFRAGGPLNVNTTDSALTAAADFAQTYTLPAGTLARDGQYVHVVWYGTRSGAAGVFSSQPHFGSAAGTVASTIDNLTAWIIELWVFRTGAATQDYAWKCSFNSDATGSTTLVLSLVLSETLSGAVTIKLKLFGISTGTVTQSGMITGLRNY